mgnify:CR=1 FL=1
MSLHNKKEYKILPAKNGFIVRFDHLPEPYEAKNQYVAYTTDEIVQIIKADLDFIETEL